MQFQRGEAGRPRVAIVHDYLSQCGGAERVVLRLASLFPQAPVFTSIFSPERTFSEFGSLDVRPSPLQGRVRPERFRRSALRYAGEFRRLDLSGYDAVIVSSSGFAHHVRHPRSLVYCYTPPRFLYDVGSYVDGRVRRSVASAAMAPLRRHDRGAAGRHGTYFAISRVTADRIRRWYRRPADVVHPPLWTAHLPADAEPTPDRPRALVLSRLLHYKRIDVAIQACALAGLPLTIIGSGPHEARLRRLAGPSASFLGTVDDEELRRAFAEHSVVLAPGREDFGFSPLEAAYAGRPTVALRAGGALETVRPGVSGLLVDGHDPRVWARAIEDALATRWSPEALRRYTEPFQGAAFDSAVLGWLDAQLGAPARRRRCGAPVETSDVGTIAAS